MKITIPSMLRGLAAAAVVLVMSEAKLSPEFDLFDNTGILNYYHAAASEFTPAQMALPAQCEVDQVHVMIRHTTRYPSNGSYRQIKALADKIASKVADPVASASLPAEMEFFRTYSLNELIPDPVTMPENLSTLGFVEAEQFGQEMRNKYAKLYNPDTTVWSGSVERVQLTAKSFAKGYFGSEEGEKNIVTSNSKDYTLGANTLTPIDTCTAFPKSGLSDVPQATFRNTVWVPKSLARLQKVWPAFEFNWGDIANMMDMCMYDMNYGNTASRRFCDLFTEEEWVNYGYNRDLSFYYRAGFGNPLGQTAGAPYAQAVAKWVSQVTTPTCQNVFVSFSHDTQLVAYAAGFGLMYDASLPSDRVGADRRFRVSRVAPMGGRIVTERIKCGADKWSVRVVVNDAVVPIDGCQSGPGLSCPLAEFAKYMEGVQAKAGNFLEKCAVDTAANPQATAEFKLYESPVKNLCEANPSC